MNTQEIQAITERFAGYDMAKARKEIGGIIITGTKLGNLDVVYSPLTKIYMVSNLNTGKLYFEGKAAEAKKFIAAQYVVTIK